MRYLHTMVRVTDLDASLTFYRNVMGFEETRRIENEAGRFTLVFLAATEDKASAQSTAAPCLELTYNWTPRPTRAAAISATSPMKSTISMHFAKMRRSMASPSIARRATAIWLSSAPRRHLVRDSAKRRKFGTKGALGLDEEHRNLVIGDFLKPPYP